MAFWGAEKVRSSGADIDSCPVVVSPAHPTDEDLSVGTPAAAALQPTAVRCAPSEQIFPCGSHVSRARHGVAGKSKLFDLCGLWRGGLDT